MGDLDEQVITMAAEAAVFDLQLDCSIEKVFQHPRSNDKWCIQFTGDYGQFCEEFRNKAGEANSPELIREKIKSHFLKMRKPVRVRRGSSRKTDTGAQGSTLMDAPLEIVGQAIDRTARLVGEAINQVSGIARSALDTEAVVSVELPAVVVEAPSPPSPAPAKSRKAKQPSKAKAAKKGSSKAAKKKASGAGKAASKAVRRKSGATARRTTGRKGR
ncbi:MAG: hypothetical protein WCF57_20740 [Pyrinomonadaceae bacterium]